jgi:RHS repeat-associated protein
VNQDAWQNRNSFVGAENWDVWADLDGSNNLKTRYARGNAVDELFARIKSDGTVAWYLTDQMASVRQMIDASGAVQDTIAYDGFGNIISETNASFGDRWKWTGRECNCNSGLQYNRSRYFNNGVGNWLTEDGIRYGAGDNNLHRYAGNSTESFIDPSGDQTNPAQAFPRGWGDWKFEQPTVPDVTMVEKLHRRIVIDIGALPRAARGPALDEVEKEVKIALGKIAIARQGEVAEEAALLKKKTWIVTKMAVLPTAGSRDVWENAQYNALLFALSYVQRSLDSLYGDILRKGHLETQQYLRYLMNVSIPVAR